MTTDHEATRQRWEQATGQGPEAVSALLLLLHDHGVPDERLAVPPGRAGSSRVAAALLERWGPLDRSTGLDPEEAWHRVLTAAETEHDAGVDLARAHREGWHDTAQVVQRHRAARDGLTEAWLALAGAADRPWATAACLLALERMGRSPDGRSPLLPPST